MRPQQVYDNSFKEVWVRVKLKGQRVRLFRRLVKVIVCPFLLSK